MWAEATGIESENTLTHPQEVSEGIGYTAIGAVIGAWCW